MEFFVKYALYSIEDAIIENRDVIIENRKKKESMPEKYITDKMPDMIVIDETIIRIGNKFWCLQI